MARINNLTNYLTDVATAIKTKKGDNTPIPASNFDTEITNLPSGYDWGKIGYSSEPISSNDDIRYAEEIYNNWNTTSTSMYRMFRTDKRLRILPMLNTSNITSTREAFYETAIKELPSYDFSNVQNFQNMCAYCYNLKYVPIINLRLAGKEGSFSYDTYLNNLFYACKSLTNESLDNILQSILTATYFAEHCTASNKTFKYVTGLKSTDFPASTIQALPHYQDFIDAGWTIGY